ncbi:hypothetical protein L9F63_023688, partial [Diploptera punctata]
MAFYGKVPTSEDDDLEALRLAALQTLGSKPSSINSNHVTNSVVRQQMLHTNNLGRGYRGGLSRTHSGRNQVFQRHRQNSNLIAIVPVSNESSPGSPGGIKLDLPQDRYCKVTSIKSEETDTPIVSTKFTRYDESDSNSSAEETDGEDSNDKSASGAEEEEEDRDVLTVEENSLDKLISELEEEMKKDDSNVPESNNVNQNPESQKKTRSSVFKSKSNACDSKTQKGQGGISTLKAVSVSSNSAKEKKKKDSHKNDVGNINDLSKSQTALPTCMSVSSHASNLHKDILHDKGKDCKFSAPQNSNLSHKTDSDFQRQLSPKLNRKSRSRSNSRVRTRSRSRSPHNSIPCSKRNRRSPSPRGKYNYSPIRSQMPRSPRGRLSISPVPRSRLSRSPSPRNRLSRSPPRSRLSRSPIRLPRSRTRSRSPLRKRYSRSPPWHSRFSPQRSSPRSRRPLSPRRSSSPRVIRSSPQRSPQSRWWPSPRRSVSPRLRRALSPPPRHLSPRTRRISISPRRPLSPIRRRLSPSPARRNPSPLRRFSPRRNLSPSLRYSRSISRSPGRFISRTRSPPVNKHRGSSRSPKRRRSTRSPSPRRRLSHSPFNRLPPRRSPLNRKQSPWSPPKQRISPIPKKIFKFSQQQRRSESPNRRSPIRPPPRSQRSPMKDGFKPLQESRVNNVRPRSRSPLASRHPDSNIHRSRSPRHPRSSSRRSRSPTSSISLSPSPERNSMNNTHRYKSPLRLHASDYRNPAPSLHTSKENTNGNRQKNFSPVPAVTDGSVSSVKQSKTKSSKRKESKNKILKGERIREYIKKESDRKSKEKTSSERIESQESSSPRIEGQNENAVSDPKMAILEARRRKFESKGPVIPEPKKIRLKAAPQSSPAQLADVKARGRIKVIFLNEEEETTAATEKSASTLDNSETLDNMNYDLDEPILELQSGDLWSSDESDSDNEGRFKSSTRTHGSGSAKVPTILPFSKLLGEPKTSARDNETGFKHKKSVPKKNTPENLMEPKKASVKTNENLKTSDEEKKIIKELVDGIQEKVKIESKISNPKAIKSEKSNVEYNAEINDDYLDEELPLINKEGDLRAELFRRRTARLRAGSLHESLPARLLQSAFEGVVGKKIIKRMETEDKTSISKRAEVKKEKTDGRRVLVLKRPPVTEQRIPSISVTIPKDNKHDLKDSPPRKLPIRMRLGLPSGGSLSEEHIVPRRRNRKVKLKRNVMIGSRPDDK